MYAISELQDKWQVLKLFVCEGLDVITVPDTHTQEILFSQHDITNKCAVELISLQVYYYPFEDTMIVNILKSSFVTFETE